MGERKERLEQGCGKLFSFILTPPFLYTQVASKMRCFHSPLLHRALWCMNQCHLNSGRQEGQQVICSVAATDKTFQLFYNYGHKLWDSNENDVAMEQRNMKLYCSELYHVFLGRNCLFCSIFWQHAGCFKNSFTAIFQMLLCGNCHENAYT
jgi:hypothetical protein